MPISTRSSKTGSRKSADAAPGLVIAYSHLWASERRRGLEEGVKNRPCATVAAQRIVEGRLVVTVIPITHSKPSNADEGVEITAALKRRLGLDALPSWVIVSETNDFLWPGADLSPAPGASPRRFDYGMLPPRFFAHVRERLLQSRLARVPVASDPANPPPCETPAP